MFQLLLVDDEVTALESLAETIPWKELDIAMTHKAESGLEALEIMEKHSIDIVVTDIRMPDMSGLELIRVINERWSGTKCIILSGYADFTYASEAVRAEASDYLLKPVRTSELLATIRKVQDVLKEEWKTINSYQKAVSTFREHLPMLRNNLLLDVLQGKSMKPLQLAHQLTHLELPFEPSQQAALMMIRLEEQFSEYDEQDLHLFEYAISNITEEVFGKHFHVWSCVDEHDYLVFLLGMKEEVAIQEGTTDEHKQKLLERLSEQLQRSVITYLKGEISLMISRWGTFPDAINTMYELLLMSFRKRVGSDHGLFFTLGDEQEDGERHTIEQLQRPPLMLHLLEAGRWEEAEQKLDDIYTELMHKFPHSQEHAIEVTCALVAMFSQFAHRNGRMLTEILNGEYEQLIRGIWRRKDHRIHEWARRTIRLMREDSESHVQNVRSIIVEQVHHFLETKLDGDTSLQAIADHVHLHPVYLSRVYKLETGEGISEYALRLRLEKASYLLKATSLKIYEIAQHVGYDSAYFTKVFKKYMGKTPQEYRES